MSEAGKRPENIFLSKRVIANGTQQANRKNNWLPIFSRFFFSFLFASILLPPLLYLLRSACRPSAPFSLPPLSLRSPVSVSSPYPLGGKGILSWQASCNGVTTDSRRGVLDCALTSLPMTREPSFFLFTCCLVATRTNIIPVLQFLWDARIF